MLFILNYFILFAHVLFRSYGHYAEGTGSVIQMADVKVRMLLEYNFLQKSEGRQRGRAV